MREEFNDPLKFTLIIKFCVNIAASYLIFFFYFLFKLNRFSNFNRNSCVLHQISTQTNFPATNGQRFIILYLVLSVLFILVLRFMVISIEKEKHAILST